MALKFSFRFTAGSFGRALHADVLSLQQNNRLYNPMVVVLESQGGAVDHKHRLGHIRKLFPHQRLKSCKYVVAHATGYQCRHFAARLAIATRPRRDPALADALADMGLFLPVPGVPRQKLHR